MSFMQVLKAISEQKLRNSYPAQGWEDRAGAATFLAEFWLCLQSALLISRSQWAHKSCSWEMCLNVTISLSFQTHAPIDNKEKLFHAPNWPVKSSITFPQEFLIHKRLYSAISVPQDHRIPSTITFWNWYFIYICMYKIILLHKLFQIYVAPGNSPPTSPGKKSFAIRLNHG